MSVFEDVEKLILEAERSPPLYKNSIKKVYSGRDLKEKLWDEICESVVTNWSEHFDSKRVNSFLI
jgi:hypothetical protein